MSRYTSSSSSTSIYSLTSSLSDISDESLSEYEDGEIIVEKIVRKKQRQQETKRPRSPPPPADNHHKKRKISHSDEKIKKSKKKKSKKESPISSPDLEMNAKIEKQLDEYREHLRKKRNTFKKYPEEHPIFETEWANFTLIMKETSGREASEIECEEEWKKFWGRKMREYDEELVEQRRAALKRKYRVLDVDERIAKSKKRFSSSPAKPRYLAIDTPHQMSGPSKAVPEASILLETREKIKLDIAPIPAPQQPLELPPLPAELPPPPPVLPPPPPPGEPTPVQSTSESKEADSSPTLLQILRLLAALEDNLGSLGATVTVVLSRVLSVERQQPGSSSSLAHEVIDLIDTCKEKLIGQLEIELIEGPRAKAAKATIEKINRFVQTVEKPKLPVMPIPIRAIPVDMPPLMPLYAEELQPPVDEEAQQSIIVDSSTGENSPNGKSPDGKSSDGKILENRSPGGKIPDGKSPDGKIPHGKSPDGKSPDGNNNKKESPVLDHLNGKELTTLIKNYQTLSDSHKGDLMRYLRKIEGSISRNDSRLPVLFARTGYNVNDLRRLGLPVEQIYESCGEINSDSSSEVTIISAPPRNLRDPRLNRQARNEQIKLH